MKPSPPTTGTARRDFEALYAQHSREVWALVYARWLNADLASDVMQEAFLRLWKQWESGEAILNPRAWLLRVARNLAEDHAKSAFRRNGTHPPQTMNGVRSHDPLPLESLEREETFTQLRERLFTFQRLQRQRIVRPHTIHRLRRMRAVAAKRAFGVILSEVARHAQQPGPRVQDRFAA